MTPRNFRTKETAVLDPLTFPLADNKRLRAAMKKGKGTKAKTHDVGTRTAATGAAGDSDPT